MAMCQFLPEQLSFNMYDQQSREILHPKRLSKFLNSKIIDFRKGEKWRNFVRMSRKTVFCGESNKFEIQNKFTIKYWLTKP